MEQDIRSIMELLQKGVITPEEAEKMIKALNKGETFSGKANKTAKEFGAMVGEGIDDVTPKLKGALKSCFEATAKFSQKVADKLSEEKAFEEDVFESDDVDFDLEDDDFDVTDFEETEETETSEEIIDLITSEDFVKEESKTEIEIEKL